MCKAYKLYHVANTLHKRGIPLLPRAIFVFMRYAFQAVIPYQAEIGPGTHFNWSGLCVAIHPRVVIGKNCNIAHQVTIGGRSDYEGVPVLADNVTVGVGAKILGPVTIRSNAIIGANAVVLKDVPANAVVAGIPARIIKYRISSAAEKISA
jgi:serine O-acetyltransferase